MSTSRVFWRIRFAISAVVLCATLPAQTTVFSGGIVNAASNAPVGLPNSSIARGSLFVIFGSRMGPTALAQSSNFPLPATLSGTSVAVTSGGTTTAATMVYTSAGQVAAIMPSTVALGNATLTVTYNGSTSASQPVVVTDRNIGIFTLNQAGSGPAVVTDPNNRVITLATSVNPGQTVTLYATGLGAISTADSLAPPVGNVGSLPTVWVGGRQATVTYAGRSPCCSGLDQINFVIPQGILGCTVPLYIQSGNSVSNFSSLSIAATGSVCSEPSRDTNTLLQTAAANGTARIANLSLNRSSTRLAVGGMTLNQTSDIGSAIFAQYTYAQLSGAQGVPLTLSVLALGSCTIASSDATGPVDSIVAKGLDAGPFIGLSGPRGSKQLTTIPSLIGSYNATLGSSSGTGSLYLDPGSYTFTGPGGADVGAFTAQLQMAASVNWTNQASSAVINRAQGATVTWTGGDSSSTVEITGYASNTMGQKTVGAGFLCVAPASAGTFTVPSGVLLALPAAVAPGGFGFLGLSTTSNPIKVNIPTIDFGYASASSSVQQTVEYR